MFGKKAASLAVIGVATASALILTGCSGSSAGDSGKATIAYTVPTSWASTGTLKQNIAAWEKKTGNKVELQAIPDADYDNTVRSRLQGKEGIDIYAGQDSTDDPSAIMLEIKDGGFEDRMEKSVLDSMRAADGKIYGYPTADGLSTFGILYNKDVFTKAGITEQPTTLDELTADFAKLRAAGTVPLFLSGADGWTLLQHRNAVNANLLGADANVGKDLAENKTTWGKVPGFTPQYDALDKWVKEGDVNKDAVTAKYEQAVKAVADGSAASIINGSWALGEIAGQNPDANIGFLPLPSAEGKTQIALSRPNIMHIAASSKVADQAKDLLSYLITPERVTGFLEKAPGIPAFKDVEISDPSPAIEDIQKLVADKKSGPAFDTSVSFPTPEQDIIAAYQELLAGRTDVAGFTNQVETAWVNAGKTAGRKGF